MSSELTNLILAIANSVVAFGALAALYVGVKQVRNSREISAIEAYEEYHRFSIEYPKFSDGADPAALTELELEQYLSFVLYVLMVGERIHILFPNAPDWLEAIEDDVRTHKRLLQSPKFSRFLEQQWVIGPILDGVLAESDAEPKLSNDEGKAS